jgi:hypothetical protein
MPTYKVIDGEFKNFPDVHEKSVKLLQERGIKNLFPI